MIDGIKCPKCGSDNIAMVLYGMPAYDEELKAKIDAGDVVLNGCEIVLGDPMYPFECQECGLRFDEEMAKQLSAKAFFSEEDYAWIEGVASAYERAEEADCAIPSDDDELIGACVQLAQDILDDDPSEFEYDLERNYDNAYRWYAAPMFSRLVSMGLEYGVACNDGACANWLGAMYYAGDIVEQDYARAKELYEIAEAKGVPQAMINLGYIYEYGRVDEPDHVKAFMQYAKAAAMFDAPEALYKLGDMYSRAKVAEKDLNTAYALYQKSLRYADEIEVKAQAAIRIAKLISDRGNAEWDIPYDPMRALELYQLAERGLRVDVARGQTYYAKRLQEALDGQDRMRDVLDDPGFWF